MRAESKKSAVSKIANWSIAALVVVGAVAIWAVSDVASNSSLLTKAFLFFIGAVIAVQIVPAILLVGSMFKGVCSLLAKKEVTVKADRK